MIPENKITHKELQELSQRRALPWLVDAGWDWCLISLAICGVLFISPWVFVPAIFVIGNRQHALAILGHDGTHYTISKNRKLNDGLSNLIAFWPVGLTTSGYRNLHFAHHAHTNTDRDPELMHRSMKAPQWDLPITPFKILHYGLRDLMGYSITDYAMILIGAKPNKRREYVYLAIYHLAFVAGALYSGFWIIPLLWYISLLTSFMMYFRFRTWLEHQGSDETHRIKLNWWGRLVFAPHEVWYHYEHHAYPHIPYYNLRKLRKKLKGKEAISLSTLLDDFKRTPEFIPSGKPLKRAQS